MHKRILFVLVAVALLASVAGAQTSHVNKLTVGPTAFNTGAINLAPGTTAAKGIYFGSDVTLYRSAEYAAAFETVQIDGWVAKSDFGTKLLPLIHTLFAPPAASLASL